MEGIIQIARPKAGRADVSPHIASWAAASRVILVTVIGSAVSIKHNLGMPFETWSHRKMHLISDGKEPAKGASTP